MEYLTVHTHRHGQAHDLRPSAPGLRDLLFNLRRLLRLDRGGIRW